MSLGQSHNERYLFKIEDYEVVRCFKRGGFGVINLVRNKETQKEYASKTNLIQTKKQNKLFISREVRILIQIQHPTIIQFRGFSYQDFKNNKNITILMDYMKEGSLADLISKEMQSLCPSTYDNTKRQIILIGIARGMMILHNHHVIHRDLKLENILLDINFHPHITDFGLSKFFDPSHSMNQSIKNSGTSPYMAPEVIEDNHFNSKADVYAFGIIMYEVVTGKRAYFDLLTGKKKLSEFQLKSKVVEGLRPVIESKMMKKSIQNLIEKCWSKDPKERPSFNEIYRKLSLSRDDYFLEFESNALDDNVIDDSDDDDDDFENDELDINTKYCLDEVDYDEVLNYVDEIKEDSKPFNGIENKESTIKNEEIDILKQEIDKLKEKGKRDESKIKSLNKAINDQSAQISAFKTSIKNDEIDKLKQEVKKLKEKRKSDESKIESLDKAINDQSAQISSFKTSMKNEEIDKLKQEIEILKEKGKSDESTIKSLNETINNQSAQILALETSINKYKSQFESKIESLNKILSNQSAQILNLETKLKDKSFIRSHPIYSELSMTEPGILELLKKQEKSPFDRLFVASQSSNDLYNIIDPCTTDNSCSLDDGKFWIEFELFESISITGIKIFSSSDFYPKSFNIEIDGKIVKKIKEADELNGKFKEMTIKFIPILGRKIRFVQTGQNWDNKDNYVHIRRIEILSDDKKYSEGVFTSLVKLSENQDPHKCPVKINSYCFDYSYFYLLDAEINASTFNHENSWFQIELSSGSAVLTGFRLKKYRLNVLKNFKIICTDDVNKSEELWTQLIEINEKTEDEHYLLDIYNFPHPSPPTRFIRLIQSGPNWENNYFLTFLHLDFFGCYFY